MITVSTIIKAPIYKVWEYWNSPAHIKNWYFASSDWHVPEAENNLKIGGRFKINMAAKDKSASFDFEGIYTEIFDFKKINYYIIDGRLVEVAFLEHQNFVTVSQHFEPESENPVDMQQAGWQAILDNFKQYVEEN